MLQSSVGSVYEQNVSQKGSFLLNFVMRVPRLDVSAVTDVPYVLADFKLKREVNVEIEQSNKINLKKRT